MKIALVGTSGSGKSAPFDDKSWKIWGVSARGDYVTRADKWFEIHRLDGEPEDWANHWRKSIRKFSKDIPEFVMMYPEEGLAPKVVGYPTQRIIDRFGTFFMTSTFSWMMALAIDELRPLNGKPKDGRIGIWGVEMEYGTEYRQQRAGLRHFMDLAKYAGIPVERLADGGLAYEPVPYPMWQDDPVLCKNAKRRKETLEDIETLDDSRHRTEILMAQNHALLQEIMNFDEHFDIDKRKAEVEKDQENLRKTLLALKEDLAASRGKFEEQCWLNDYLLP